MHPRPMLSRVYPRTLPVKTPPKRLETGELQIGLPHGEGPWWKGKEASDAVSGVKQQYDCSELGGFIQPSIRNRNPSRMRV